MHPGEHARSGPDRVAAVIAETGRSLTYRELDDASNQLARALYRRGVRQGDHLAVCMENSLRYVEVFWAAWRSGLYFTPINSHLTAAEAAHIIEDCGAKVLIASGATRETTESALSLIADIAVKLMADGDPAAGWESYEDVQDLEPAEPLPEQPMGQLMMYSSGTTGFPKGILRPLPGHGVDQSYPFVSFTRDRFELDADSVYLTPGAPLYHSAPTGTVLTSGTLGATNVIMERFSAEGTLAAIERFRCTHVQLVPTMFVRMLKLPEEVRNRYDLSSLRMAIHAAAPCPAEVKQAMIEWWGPIVLEYYAGSENLGLTVIDSREALSHPGSVGRPLYGEVHVLGADGEELPKGETGLIYWGGFADFEYHGDPGKTREARDPKGRGWATYNDIGYLDDDGYLYLTDRKAHTIVSGGVNIYPQETENVLILHPKVLDVAVFGVPDPDLGEQVKAVVQLVDPADAGPDLEAELIAHCGARLARFKCPRSVDFEAELPRTPAGKLLKRRLRDRYWAEKEPTR